MKLHIVNILLLNAPSIVKSTCLSFLSGWGTVKCFKSEKTHVLFCSVLIKAYALVTYYEIVSDNLVLHFWEISWTHVSECNGVGSAHSQLSSHIVLHCPWCYMCIDVYLLSCRSGKDHRLQPTIANLHYFLYVMFMCYLICCVYS